MGEPTFYLFHDNPPISLSPGAFHGEKHRVRAGDHGAGVAASTRRRYRPMMSLARFAFTLRLAQLVVSGAVQSLAGCSEEQCFFGRPSRCEGNIKVYCPGGWMNFDIRLKRKDCGAEGQWCANPIPPLGADCLDSYGDCDPATFVPGCTVPTSWSLPHKTTCIGGHIFESDDICDVPPKSPAADPPKPAGKRRARASDAGASNP